MVDDPAPTALVGGHRYGVAVSRGLKVTADDLTQFDRIVRATDPSVFLDGQAFALRGVDGSDFLVARTAPGLSDDAGSWGEYLALFGTSRPLPALCPYFVRLPPSWC